MRYRKRDEAHPEPPTRSVARALPQAPTRAASRLHSARRLDILRAMRWRATLVLATALAACGASDTAVGADGVLIVFQEPPRPKLEKFEPRAGFLWMRGRWAWRDGEWQWTPGSWERARAGYAWTEGRWERRGHHWEWVDGRWIAAGTEPVTEPDSGSGLGSATAP